MHTPQFPALTGREAAVLPATWAADLTCGSARGEHKCTLRNVNSHQAAAPGTSASPTRRRTLTWALGFTGVTLIGLAVLSIGLLLMLALVGGFIRAIAPEAEIAAIGSGMFGWAFALAAGVALVTAAGVARLAEFTAARRWPPVLQGLAAAAVAAVLSLLVMLLRLGIDPVGFLTAL